MPRRTGKRERSKVTKRRKVSAGVRVEAVKAASGRPAMAVEVDIAPDRVKRQIGEFEEVEEVVASVPAVAPGERGVRWEEERLQKRKDEETGAGERTVRYATTHYGPSESGRHGVRVRIRTSAGTVETRRVSAREADAPPSRRAKPPTE